MTFNLESFEYYFSMLQSKQSHWLRSVKQVVNGYLCVTASRSLSVVTQRKQLQRYKEGKRFLLEKFQSISRTFVQNPEQKEAIEHLLKG